MKHPFLTESQVLEQHGIAGPIINDPPLSGGLS